jgi:ABC-type Fe3+ transport system permease subunit
MESNGFLVKTSAKNIFLFILFLLAVWWPSLWSFTNWQYFDWQMFIKNSAVFSSIWQALLSAMITLSLAFLGAWGLVALQTKLPPSVFLILEYFILLPSFLPPLIVIVSVLSLFSFFPFGFWGVVLMHSLFEVGLVAILLSRSLSHKQKDYSALFRLYSKSMFIQLKIFFPLLKKDLFLIFGILFLFFLTSLSVPMILSGGRFVSLELGIYSLLQNSRDWNSALHLYLLQILFLLPTLLLFPRAPLIEENSLEGAEFPGAGSFWALIALLPTTFVFIGLLLKLPRGIEALNRENLNLLPGLVGSLLLGFMCAGLCFVFLNLVAYFYQYKSFRGGLNFWTIPSFVMVGFYFRSFDPMTSQEGLTLLVVALSFLSLPTLAKLGLYQKMDLLDSQIEMAELLNAKSWKIFRKITLPVVLPTISLLSGICGIWSMGDFAISRLFLSSDLTLSLTIQSLVERYRWDQALVVSWVLLFCSSIVFFFFGSLAYVANQKIK